MPMRYNGDIMERLKAAGWSEYKIRQQNKLSTSTIKALKAGDTHITVRVLGRICDMLGGAQPNDVLVYESDHATIARANRAAVSDDEVERFIEGVYAEYDALENPGVPRSVFVGSRLSEFYASHRQ